MNIRFPMFPPTPLGNQLQQAFQIAATAFANVVSPNEGVERVMLRSPNGTIYAITTDNAGVLTTTAISGKNREI